MGKHELSESGTCRWRRRKEARPAEILEAALDLFAEKGYAATKLTEVATRAGVSKGTVYLYYESKEALFQALVKEMVLPHIEQSEHMVDEYNGATVDLMQGLVQFWLDNVIHTKVCGIPKLVIAEAKNFPDMARFYVDNVVTRGTALVERILQRGVDKGEFRVTDISHSARAVMAPMIFAAIWEQSLAPFDNRPYDVNKYLQ
ncbi:MAG: TetR/AcrR family transcriptional regulator, partial [Acidiferrobacterales bacterium]